VKLANFTNVGHFVGRVACFQAPLKTQLSNLVLILYRSEVYYLFTRECDFFSAQVLLKALLLLTKENFTLNLLFT
jgi:hypothetical protein